MLVRSAFCYFAWETLNPKEGFTSTSGVFRYLVESDCKVLDWKLVSPEAVYGMSFGSKYQFDLIGDGAPSGPVIWSYCSATDETDGNSSIFSWLPVWSRKLWCHQEQFHMMTLTSIRSVWTSFLNVLEKVRTTSFPWVPYLICLQKCWLHRNLKMIGTYSGKQDQANAKFMFYSSCLNPGITTSAYFT